MEQSTVSREGTGASGAVTAARDRLGNERVRREDQVLKAVCAVAKVRSASIYPDLKSGSSERVTRKVENGMLG